MSDGSALNEPQLLPENWGPIFGLAGVTDRLNNLSWLGEQYSDMGWFEVGDAPAEASPSTKSELAWKRAKQLLAESDWSLLSDVPMLPSQRESWIEYRRALREVRLQAGFPDNIQWPRMPE